MRVFSDSPALRKIKYSNQWISLYCYVLIIWVKFEICLLQNHYVHGYYIQWLHIYIYIPVSGLKTIYPNQSKYITSSHQFSNKSGLDMAGSFSYISIITSDVILTASSPVSPFGSVTIGMSIATWMFMARQIIYEIQIFWQAMFDYEYNFYYFDYSQVSVSCIPSVLPWGKLTQLDAENQPGFPRNMIYKWHVFHWMGHGHHSKLLAYQWLN